MQSYGRVGTSPKTPKEVFHTDIEGSFRANFNGMSHFRAYINGAGRGQRRIALKTLDAAVETTGHYPDQMLRERVSVEYIRGDGAGELERSGNFLEMLP